MSRALALCLPAAAVASPAPPAPRLELRAASGDFLIIPSEAKAPVSRPAAIRLGPAVRLDRALFAAPAKARATGLARAVAVPVATTATTVPPRSVDPDQAPSIAIDPAAIEAAQQKLRQSFSQLKFERFAPAPLRGQLYQAEAGGRIIYFAPDSGHLLFGAIYDKDGVNLTAQAQDAGTTRRLAGLAAAAALTVGPADAPEVTEFTDPDCPYCQALERYWSAKAAEGKAVRRRIHFITAIHPGAAAKAEHILCSPDPVAAFHAIYAGAKPTTWLRCKAGADRIAADARLTEAIGISGTPTLVVGGRLIAGFQQAELEAFLEGRGADHAQR